MTPRALFTSAALLTAVFAIACGESTEPAPIDGQPQTMRHHLQQFAVNDSPIDQPGSPGELRAIQYAKTYLESLGLSTTIQSVPLVRMIPVSSSVEVFTAAGSTHVTQTVTDNFIIWAGRQDEHVSLHAPVVFAGYGIVSPEYHRDDYKNADVTGRIVVVLDGSPKTGSDDDLGTLGETYYGTSRYKYAEAARHGASALLIVPNLDAAPWATLQRTTGGSIVDIDAAVVSHDAEPMPDVQGWLSPAAAMRLFQAVGLDFAGLVVNSREAAFLPTALEGLSIKLEMTSRIARFTSHDLLAVLQGETSEYVMVGGRWNELDPGAWTSTLAPPLGLHNPGELPSAAADDAAAVVQATDDGSGAAVVMETARMLVTQHPRPLRSVVFMIATALKPGVLGLEYYMHHPPPSMPIDRLNGLIFLDHADLSGTSARVGKIGTDSDEALAQIARSAATVQGRLFELDSNEEKRLFYKLSETTLARDAVRTLYLTTRPEEDGSGRVLRHLARRDQVAGQAGLMQAPPNDPSRDPALLATITLRVANATNWPARVEPVPSIR